MRISHWCAVQVNELDLCNSYMAIYECLLKVEELDNSKFNAFAKLRGILDEIIDEDSKNIYNIELLKIKEYLEHNKTCEVPYESEDMWHVVLESGLMNKAATQLLVDNGGLGEDELEEFKESLYSTMHSEVHILYEEIERNIDHDVKEKK